MDVKVYRKETLSEMIFLIFQVEEAKRKSREETAYNKNAKLIIQSQDDSAAWNFHWKFFSNFLSRRKNMPSWIFTEDFAWWRQFCSFIVFVVENQLQGNSFGWRHSCQNHAHPQYVVKAPSPFCRVRDINAVAHQYVPMFHVKRSPMAKATDSGAE